MVGSKSASFRAVCVGVAVGAASIVAAYFAFRYSWSGAGDSAALMLLLFGTIVAGTEIGRFAAQRTGRAVAATGAILFFGLLLSVIAVMMPDTGPRAAIGAAKFKETMNTTLGAAMLAVGPFIVGGLLAYGSASLQIRSKTTAPRRVAWMVLIVLVLAYTGVEVWARPQIRASIITEANGIARTAGVELPSRMTWSVSIESPARRVRTVIGRSADVTVRGEGGRTGIYKISFSGRSSIRSVRSASDAGLAAANCRFTRDVAFFDKKINFVADGDHWTASCKLPKGIVSDDSNDCGCLLSDNAKLIVYQDGRIELLLPAPSEC